VLFTTDLLYEDENRDRFTLDANNAIEGTDIAER
jgi:hypothetical protein